MGNSQPVRQAVIYKGPMGRLLMACASKCEEGKVEGSMEYLCFSIASSVLLRSIFLL